MPESIRAGQEQRSDQVKARRSGRLSPAELELLSSVRLRYRFSQPLDDFAAAGSLGAMPGQESWSVVAVNDDAEEVAHFYVHRVPLANGLDVAWECETGEDVPGDPAYAVLEHDKPNDNVLERLGLEDSDVEPGESFLLLESAAVSAAHLSSAAQALLLATALNRMRTREDLFAVARSSGSWRSFDSTGNSTEFDGRSVLRSVGFTSFSPGIWLLTDWALVGHRIRLNRRRLGLPETHT